jgi:hypothetical protein
MSRAAVYDAITSDATLNGMGFHGDPDRSVLVAYDGDQRPNDNMFMVLRWETRDIDLRGDDSTVTKGPRHLVIWVHMYKGFSTDFNRIDKVIDQLDNVLTAIIDTPGADGRTVCVIEPEGQSRDLRDTTYDTFCRSTAYRVIDRVT